jgi:hypothetical protein
VALVEALGPDNVSSGPRPRWWGCRMSRKRPMGGKTEHAARRRASAHIRGLRRHLPVRLYAQDRLGEPWSLITSP